MKNLLKILNLWILKKLNKYMYNKSVMFDLNFLSNQKWEKYLLALNFKNDPFSFSFLDISHIF